MEIKKNFEADLENEKSSLFLMGLLVALCGTFIAMEWTHKNTKPFNIEDVMQVPFIEDDPVPITVTAPPPPPVIEQPSVEDPIFKKTPEATSKPITITGESDPEAITPDPSPAILNNPIEVAPEIDPEANKIYKTVDKKAAYPGGLPQLKKDLASRLMYPKAALEARIAGTVIVEFTVEKDGTVSNVIVRRSIDPVLDKEAVRVVNTLTGWTPAQMGTRNVRSVFSLPVAFTLY